MTKAQTGLALMQCLINARNLPGHGFTEISRLAQTVPAYTMRYPGFEQVGEMVERLLHMLSSVPSNAVDPLVGGSTGG